MNPEQTEDNAPQRGAYGEAEVQLRLKDLDSATEARETVVETTVAQVLLCIPTCQLCRLLQ